MIKIYTEEILDQAIVKGESFRPEAKGFALVTKGDLAIKLNNEKMDLATAEMIILSQENIYKLKDYSEDLSFYILLFNEESFKQHINFNFNRLISLRIIQNRTNQTDYKIKLDTDDAKRYTEWIKQLSYFQQEENTHQFKEQITVSLGALIAFSLADKLSTNWKRNTNTSLRKKQITQAFIQLAEGHFKQKRNLEFYANRLHISIKYLSNSVRDTTGLAPTSFLSNFVISEAKDLLLNTSDPIYQIAESLNFADAYSFSKFYKKNTGISPSEFRKTNQGIDTI